MKKQKEWVCGKCSSEPCKCESKKEDMTTTADIPNPADTAQGPRVKSTYMHDRRRRKDQLPVLLKRFRKYIEDHG